VFVVHLLQQVIYEEKRVMKVNPYLMFDGNCREAVTFYAEVFGAELNMQTYAQAPPEMCAPSDKIMHAHLAKEAFVLMASDAGMPGQTPHPGDNVQLAVSCDSEQEQDLLFAALTEGGQIKMPLQDTFWGARFGMLIDKFGIHWMLDMEKPKS
jgi:PhnB protein